MAWNIYLGREKHYFVHERTGKQIFHLIILNHILCLLLYLQKEVIKRQLQIREMLKISRKGIRFEVESTIILMLEIDWRQGLLPTLNYTFASFTCGIQQIWGAHFNHIGPSKWKPFPACGKRCNRLKDRGDETWAGLDPSHVWWPQRQGKGHKPKNAGGL